VTSNILKTFTTHAGFLSNKASITPALHRDTIKGISCVFTQDDNVNYQLARIWKRI
jgi:hypothetical protein